MDCLPKDKILLYNEDSLQAVRKCYDLDKPGVVKDLVNILEEWVKDQKHFTKKSFDRRYLETTIIASKGSIERAKSRLDKACTFRTLKPELFVLYDIRRFFLSGMKMSSHAILPKMTKDHERVYILQNIGKKFEAATITNFIRMVPNYSEYLRLHDYAASYYVVLDYIDANFADLITKLSITDCQDVVSYLLDCCGFRLKACYLISSSKVIEAGVAIAKQLLSAKLSKRVHVLKTRAELTNFIDADILPIEYGGKERSLEELHVEWIDILSSEEHMAYFKEINSARTDESLRQRATFNEQYMGMPGSFRMLSVD
ncbi:CRAL/TRIO domain-containing protein [Phthorimaea operculella]|nr:CRAL/TRIO domain-containing protein [Phthorimaea operculella]